MSNPQPAHPCTAALASIPSASPDIRICFIGDSFTAGIGDPENLGWVGRVTAAALARGHHVTAYNLGIRRETSADILRRWRQECEPRTLPGVDTRVVLCFGANDAALDNGRRRLSLDQTLANARTLLREIKTRYPVLLISPPPVGDAEYDARVGELAQALAQVAREENVPCLDVFTPLQHAAYWRPEVIANDGAHPRSGGYREFAALVINWSAWWFHAPTTTQATLTAHATRVAESDGEIDACFPVMAQLRPHLNRDEFLARVRHQMQHGYRLAYLLEADTVRAVAGYRVSENLAWGKFLYVDDLVTDATQRSRGAGRALLAWLKEETLRQDCAQLHLDSGRQRLDAHRFYLRERLDNLGFHFATKLTDVA
jgi:lysophospholipase L1-like esterase/GNAT superfamily N-acetyltransferase